MGHHQGSNKQSLNLQYCEIYEIYIFNFLKHITCLLGRAISENRSQNFVFLLKNKNKQSFGIFMEMPVYKEAVCAIK